MELKTGHYTLCEAAFAAFLAFAGNAHFGKGVGLSFMALGGFDGYTPRLGPIEDHALDLFFENI
jgi:hypothetical protein